MVGDSESHGGRGFHRFMDAAEIVVGNVQRHGRRVVFELFGKAVGEPGKAPAGHPNRQVLPLDIAGRNLGGNAAHGFAGYDYYGGRE
jgi:hypothetical protein